MVELRDTAQISDHVLNNSLVRAQAKREEWRVTRERERWCFSPRVCFALVSTRLKKVYKKKNSLCKLTL